MPTARLFSLWTTCGFTIALRLKPGWRSIPTSSHWYRFPHLVPNVIRASSATETSRLRWEESLHRGISKRWRKTSRTTCGCSANLRHGPQPASKPSTFVPQQQHERCHYLFLPKQYSLRSFPSAGNAHMRAMSPNTELSNTPAGFTKRYLASTAQDLELTKLARMEPPK